MIAYVDSSVVLRLVLRDPRRLRESAMIDHVVTSKLTRVECHRSLDRLWHAGTLDDQQLMAARRGVETLLDGFVLKDLDEDVLDLASHPFATELGPLDALHLATAILQGAGKATAEQPVFATHEPVLAKAAREMHIEVIGI